MIIILLVALNFSIIGITCITIISSGLSKNLKRQLDEARATAKAYDDAAAYHNSRANKACLELAAKQLELAEIKRRLEKFDRRHGIDGKFVGKKGCRSNPAVVSR